METRQISSSTTSKISSPDLTPSKLQHTRASSSTTLVVSPSSSKAPELPPTQPVRIQPKPDPPCIHLDVPPKTPSVVPTSPQTPKAPSAQKQKQPQQPKPKPPPKEGGREPNQNQKAGEKQQQQPHSNDNPEKKSQKQMTKVERRELQEKQRAAKEAAKAQAAAASATAKSAKAPPQNPKPSYQSAASEPAKEPEIAVHHRSRIFAHFAKHRTGAPLGTGVKGEVHPAIVRLGAQFAEMKIVGSNARCIAMLQAFKQVIQDYVTPGHTTLSRDLMHYMSPQISYLVTARPLSVTMGNAIRALKYEISILDIDLPEQDAKSLLCQKIDTYISERIVLAGSVIGEYAIQRVKDGDVVLTYARSSVVEQTLLNAWDKGNGKKFSVVVVDSRPLLEGKNLLRVLTSANIPCTYLLLPSLPSILPTISLVFIGAHSLNSNGAVYSRAGTASVAMMAQQARVPVCVLSETYKYSGVIGLDSFSRNELAPAPRDPLPTYPKFAPRGKLILDTPGLVDPSSPQYIPNMEVISPLYDLTPASLITVLVTEVGLIPPGAISTLSGGRGAGAGAAGGVKGRAMGMGMGS